LHSQRQEIQDISYRHFKTHIRSEVLDIKRKSIKAIEDACDRVLKIINKSEMNNLEKEMEIY
jgi:hypothetical protein